MISDTEPFRCLLFDDLNDTFSGGFPFVSTAFVTDSCAPHQSSLDETMALETDWGNVSVGDLLQLRTAEGYGIGVSLRGQLRDAENTFLQIERPSDCHTLCREVSQCSGFTWLSGTCYILSTISDLRRDSLNQMVSGFRENNNLAIWADHILGKQGNLKVHHEADMVKEIRLVYTCTGVSLGANQISVEGRTIEHVRNSQACFAYCRYDADCLGMTHDSLLDQCRLHYSAPIELTNDSMKGVFLSCGAACDATGQIDIGVRSLKINVIPFVLSAISMGVFLLSGLVALVYHLRRRRQQKKKKQPEATADKAMEAASPSARI
eukprot:Blabericola_migrator_1__2826@NODE_1808_length_3759_cov_73_705038_g954_i1_p2_GENE_NODE_1808_length_3759_cov_73_705038_g954_i1NODE_1808_length_3759_cov_73_705038_g954_i1_p2_ORF_typecomplete_len321_score36_27PAN_4/PF14295_6/0_00021PAN_4/PF14295_6/0_6PAN_4/PF14295_6/3_6e02PAN_3/PF08277_12/0_63PAN_3/PF08277_12/0_95Rax2/PF12768_7/3_7e03Rax2/PF12768_7/0_14WAP/PF00095_21/1_2e02WAP/PF00095_21/1_9TMEM51/PF15345_6/0_11Cytochrom_C_asm/PF01578_20/1_6e03Cytochrom_C_asm/PF01578_20/0_26DUF282/PF03380_14/8_7e03D